MIETPAFYAAILPTMAGSDGSDGSDVSDGSDEGDDMAQEHLSLSPVVAAEVEENSLALEHAGKQQPAEEPFDDEVSTEEDDRASSVSEEHALEQNGQIAVDDAAAAADEDDVVAANDDDDDDDDEEEDDDVAVHLSAVEEHLHDFHRTQGDDDDDALSDSMPQPPPPPPPEDGWSDDDDDDDASQADGSGSDEAAEQKARDDELFEDVAFVMGHDREGHRLIVVYPRTAARVLSGVNLGDTGEDRLVNFIVRLVTRVAVAGRYTVVLHCAGAEELVSNRRRLCWLLASFARLQRLPHRKYLHRMVLVHPGQLVQSVMWLFYPAVSRKFWSKIVLARTLNDLASHVSALAPLSPTSSSPPPAPTAAPGQGVWPPYVLEFDQQLANAPPRQEATARPATTFESFWRVTRPFGLPVAALADKSPFGIPMMVVRCVGYLCTHGIKVHGLFRVPGNAEDIADARQRLESGNDIDMGGVWSAKGRPATLETVHIVAALLKSFFRDMPAIITPAAYKDVMRDAKSAPDNNQLAVSLAAVMVMLSPKSRVTLAFLMYFLNYVSLFEKFNAMTVPNLAIVWAPNLLRNPDEGGNKEELNTLPYALRVAQTMINHCREVFPLGADTRLPPCMHAETGEPLPLADVLLADATVKPEEGAQRTRLPMADAFNDSESDDDDDNAALFAASAGAEWTATAADMAAMSLAELRARIKARGRDPGAYVITQAELGRHLNLKLSGDTEREHRKVLARAESMAIADARVEFGLPLVNESALLRDVGRNNPASADALDRMSNKELKSYLASHGVDPSLYPMRGDLLAEARRLFSEAHRGADGGRHRRVSSSAGSRAHSPPLRGNGEPSKRSGAMQPARPSPPEVPSPLPTHSPSASRGLKAFAKDLLKSSNDLVVDRVAHASAADENEEDVLLEMMDIDEQSLKHEPLFAQFQENAVAVQALESYVSERRKMHANASLEDVSTMAPQELRELIERHGMSHVDCKGVGALRVRARQCFDDDSALADIIGIPAAQPLPATSLLPRAADSSASASPVGSAKHSPLLRVITRSASSSSAIAREHSLKRLLKRSPAGSPGSPKPAQQ